MAGRVRKQSEIPPFPHESAMEEKAPATGTEPGSATRPPRPRRQPSRPARSIWHWLFTMLFLGLVGLLVGVMLGGMISS